MAENTNLYFTLFNLSHQFPLLGILMIFAAEPLIYLVYVLAGVLVIVGKPPEKRAMLIWILSLVIALLLARIIRIFVFEPRPFITFQTTPLIGLRNVGPESFPSIHALISSTIAFSYYSTKSKFAPLFLVLMILIGTARIFVGVHYPLDVVAGFGLGFLASLFSLYIIKLFKKKLIIS